MTTTPKAGSSKELLQYPNKSPTLTKSRLTPIYGKFSGKTLSYNPTPTMVDRRCDTFNDKQRNASSHSPHNSAPPYPLVKPSVHIWRTSSSRWWGDGNVMLAQQILMKCDGFYHCPPTTEKLNHVQHGSNFQTCIIKMVQHLCYHGCVSHYLTSSQPLLWVIQSHWEKTISPGGI